MTYFEILKRILIEFIFFLGIKKFLLMLFILILTTALGSSESFFAAKMIEYIELYFKNESIITNNLIVFLIIYIAFIFVNSLIRYIYKYSFVETYALKYYNICSQNYKEKIIYMSEFEYLNKKSGSLYKTFDRGLEGIYQAVENLFGDVAISIISVLGLTVVMIIINPIMALAVLGLVPIMIFIGVYYNEKTNFLQKNINEYWELFYSKMGDYLSNLTLVKTLTLESKISKELKKVQVDALSLQLPLSKRWAIAEVYVQFLVNISRFIVLGTGLYLISIGNLSFAELFLYFSLIGFIYYPLSFLFGQYKNFQKILEGIKRFYEAFDTLEQDTKNDSGEELSNISGNIAFKNVDFKYHAESEDVIKNLNLEIKAGQKVALVGSTGSGKSTLTKLLLRLFELDSGEILIDDKNIAQFTKSSLRKHIGIVMQDNSLFNTSIKQNMLYAKPDASDEEIKKALKKAKADFVFKQEKGLDTEIGERGLKLSGGEKQRINIARIFLKNPEILILDEATSALDNKTEVEIQKSLDELMIGKTSLIIAHRLSTIKKVDKIFVLENGKIVETGNYEELIEKKGKFFELANPDKLILS